MINAAGEQTIVPFKLNKTARIGGNTIDLQLANYEITIEELLIAKEGERYQFKEAKNQFDYDEAVRCCCALANCGGGKLVFGITDKRPRKVVGSSAFEE